MEALALLFVIGTFVALLVPEKKPKKPSPGDDLLKGLKAAAGEIFDAHLLKDPPRPDKKPGNPWASPWAVMIFTIFIGILLTSI
ncbi:hypothetical protein [Leptolyngbya iicbica]|uniref:Uncharacterized protein n=2 Tax=Cyanophyceae TaxID=3028117 RepID=A0A4Q7E5U9_9CYAN|nr:hypothetical protein [Leptolyngbya sp. LK]RZM77732.1 hypothetical protein DYY88_14205 [Leptolyngbya sp. LK]